MIQLIDKTDKTVINVTASEIDASLAESARIKAEAARDEAVPAAAISVAARDKAEQWAEEDEDVEVEAGKFSAKHWAAKAEIAAAVIYPAFTEQNDPWSIV